MRKKRMIRKYSKILRLMEVSIQINSRLLVILLMETIVSRILMEPTQLCKIRKIVEKKLRNNNQLKHKPQYQHKNQLLQHLPILQHLLLLKLQHPQLLQPKLKLSKRTLISPHLNKSPHRKPTSKMPLAQQSLQSPKSRPTPQSSTNKSLKRTIPSASLRPSATVALRMKTSVTT